MTWKAKMNSEIGFIELTYSETVTAQDVSEATANILTLTSVDTPLKFLISVVGANLELSVIDLFNLPESWDSFGFGRFNSMAVFVGEDMRLKDDMKFLENVSVNRGWNVKIFTDRKDASEWLASQQPLSPS